LTTPHTVDGSKQECIVVKSIYADDNDFFYYLDTENKWGSVRKSNVISMMQVSQTQRQDEFANPVIIDITYY